MFEKNIYQRIIMHMDDNKIEEIRTRYIHTLKPLFFPEDLVSNDVIKYFCSLLRVVGIEDRGWDPYLESRSALEDLNSLLNIALPEDKFPDVNQTKWRLGLLFYSHIVEMDAPYEVLMNLLRFKLGKGYSPNPYFMFLTEKQKKNYAKRGLYPKDKINLIKHLSTQANLNVGDLFDEFYNGKLRNSISHSDYILTEEEFRCRNGTGGVGAFKISLEELNVTITKSKIFLSTFFGLEYAARKHWGTYKHKAIPYDPHYKGLMEVLVDEDDLMCGFKVHWPNHSESMYRRTKDGCDMSNCMLGKNLDVELFVGLYAKKPRFFSPLVEYEQQARYTKIEGIEGTLVWPDELIENA